MRVLLPEGANQASAETILYIDGFTEAVWVPLLSTDAYEFTTEAFVVEVLDSVVERAITVAVGEADRPCPPAEQLFEQVRWLAGLLNHYVIGSRVRLHLTATGCALDFSKAFRTAEAEAEFRRRGRPSHE